MERGAEITEVHPGQNHKTHLYSTFYHSVTISAAEQVEEMLNGLDLHSAFLIFGLLSHIHPFAHICTLMAQLSRAILGLSILLKDTLTSGLEEPLYLLSNSRWLNYSFNMTDLGHKVVSHVRSGPWSPSDLWPGVQDWTSLTVSLQAPTTSFRLAVTIASLSKLQMGASCNIINIQTKLCSQLTKQSKKREKMKVWWGLEQARGAKLNVIW